MSSAGSNDISLAFDIGHSSIGWAVLKSSDVGFPTVTGAGTVLFPKNDCLASARRVFRGQRRHTASARNRVKNLKALLNALGVLKEEQLDANPYPWPWLLAARVLRSKRGETLSWSELWGVLRWYGHNRGYDGNALWANDGAEKEDTKMVNTAHALMRKHGTTSMAETICAVLGVDPQKDGNPPLGRYFKGENAAFSRPVVVQEVRQILRAHRGVLVRCDEDFEAALCDDWHGAAESGLKLPRRYFGGLLFGQYIPRFDNRILPGCPIDVDSFGNPRHTPSKHSKAFYRYRWGMLMANLRVDDPLEPGRALRTEERAQLHERMTESGYLTKTSLRKALREITGCEATQLDTFFLDSSMEEALGYDPVKRYLQSERLKRTWTTIPPKFQKIFASQLFKKRRASFAYWREQMVRERVDAREYDAALKETFEKQRVREHERKKREKSPPPLWEDFLEKPLSCSALSGRAPFSTRLLNAAFEESLAGRHPFVAGGCLDQRQDGTDPNRPLRAAKTREKNLDRQTNNHLVRHRLLIFRRLLGDLVRKYGSEGGRIDRVTIETVRDFQEFSGMTSKEKASLFRSKQDHHRRTAKKLEEEFRSAGSDTPITASLIRKARIADDHNWQCPFTSKQFSPLQLQQMERDHVIPYTQRPSDSLESVVITFPEVNRMKGNLSAFEFVERCQGKAVDGAPHLNIRSIDNYRRFVRGLKQKGPSDDDRRRWRRRQDLMLTRNYDPRKGEFTGRDLTQTSFINKLALRQAEDFFSGRPRRPVFCHIPGSATGAMRATWDIGGCLIQSCPLAADHDGLPKPKGELREITHLHHALDAIVLGLATSLNPRRDNRVWELIAKRTLTDVEKGELRSLVEAVRFSKSGRWRLPDLPAGVKRSIVNALAEKRVVQHVPARMRGLKVQQNTWAIKEGLHENGKVMIERRDPRDKGRRCRKRKTVNSAKLLGHGKEGSKGEAKLRRLKGALIVEENFGVALDPEPTVIPFLKVYPQLRRLKEHNGGRWPRVLRNGMLIEVPEGRYTGLWRIRVISNTAIGICVDIIPPDVVKKDKAGGCKRNVRLNTLLEDRMKLVPTGYAGR